MSDSAGFDDMTDYAFKIPSALQQGQHLDFALKVGESAFVLGANGTGKSSLMHKFYSTFAQKCVRISAHRQTWFASDALELSPQSKRQSEQNIRSQDSQLNSRWTDPYAAQRANIAIYELIDAENIRARKIAAAVDGDNLAGAKAISATEAPLRTINDLLRLSGLVVKVSAHENERILATRDGSQPYSIAELSDGERNALLIGAAVLTAKPDSLILIDEPERHLHRSIISPLLTHLFAKRPDCAFIVSTHDVMLAMDHPESKLLLVRSCKYQGNQPSAWAIDVISDSRKVPEGIKADIFGARQKLLFIEGTESSMDRPLYSTLFPSITVVPKGNCREVEQSTAGVRAAAELHWLQAFGLIDRDGRTNEDCQSLEGNGVFAVASYSVEAIYYHEKMLDLIASRIAQVDGSDASQRVAAAKAAAVGAIKPHRDRLCTRVVVRKLTEHVMRQMPLERHLAASALQFSVDTPALLRKEHDRFDADLVGFAYQELMNRYPVRETPALDSISRELGFRNRGAFESAVLKACGEEALAREIALSCLGNLPAAIAGADQIAANAAIPPAAPVGRYPRAAASPAQTRG